MLARSVVAVGVCANATLASNAEPAKPAIMYFANIGVLLSFKKAHRENPTLRQAFRINSICRIAKET
jgi:hypothetical protein